MILITGLGAITPAGDFTLRAPLALPGAVTTSAAEKPSASGPLPAAAAIPGFELKNYLESPKTYLDRASALCLAGCALALRDAGLSGPPAADRDDFGVVAGTLYGCVDTMRTFEGKLAESGPRAVSPLLFSHSYFNSPVSLAAIEWGLKGYHATVCGPEAAFQAVELARDAILAGHATQMLAGGFDAVTAGRELEDNQSAPGEGAIFLVLETAEVARARGTVGIPLDNLQHFGNGAEGWGCLGSLLSWLRAGRLGGAALQTA